MPKAAETKADIAENVSFEQAMKELEEIVRRLESGGADLESAIGDYLRGTALQQHCQRKLSDARLRIDSILKTESALTLQPFESTGS